MATEVQIAQLLSRLEQIPARIERITTGRNQAVLSQAPADSEWSVAEIFAHIRASDDIIAYRAYAVLVRDAPSLLAYDDRRWSEITKYVQADIHTSLTLFALKRRELVTMLHSIEVMDWGRMGTHEVMGPISLWDLMARMVEHEEEHCAQIEAIFRE
jgi:hypothetical protein